MRERFRGLQGGLPFGLYPWAWAQDERPSFEALQGAPASGLGGGGLGGGGASLLCAPILQALILNRFPDETREWVRRVRRWPIKRIVPSHLANDIRASGDDLARAFDFLDEVPGDVAAATSRGGGTATATGPLARLRSLRGGIAGVGRARVLAADFELLKRASEVCTRLGITDPVKAGVLKKTE